MNLKSSRRGFFGTLGTIVAAIAGPRKLFSARVAAPESAAGVSGFGQTGNPYVELGVTPVINAEGTMTVLGGSLIRPEVEAVMAQAARHFINIPELEVAAGLPRAAHIHAKLPAATAAVMRIALHPLPFKLFRLCFAIFLTSSPILPRS